MRDFDRFISIRFIGSGFIGSKVHRFRVQGSRFKAEAGNQNCHFGRKKT